MAVPNRYTVGVTFDEKRVVDAVRAAIKATVDGEIGRIEYEAKQLAPVRKIFDSRKIGRGTRTSTRRTPKLLSATQIAEESSIRSKLGLGPARLGVSRQYTTRLITNTTMDKEWFQSLSPQKQRSSRSGTLMRNLASHNLRRVDDLGRLQKGAEQFLTSRGRYEVAHAFRRGIDLTTGLPKPGTAVAQHAGSAMQVGGRLKSEIKRTDGRWVGKVYVAAVRSPTPYAKYVEFGTHHAPAQPYMRPALNASRRRFKSSLQRALNSVNYAGKLRGDIGTYIK